MIETLKAGEEKYKFFIMAILLAVSCLLAYYFHFVLEYGAIFTHFFYIPIILASLWWKKKGLIVPVFLALILLISHTLFRSHILILDDLFRAIIFIGIGLVFASMSERIAKTGEALLESEQALKATLAGSPIPAFVIDTNHTITHWNIALEEMSGIKADEVIGTNQHWKAFYNEERPCMADLLIDQLSEDICVWYDGAAHCDPSEFAEQAYEATDFFPALGNEGKWLRFTAAILRDSGGHILGAIETLEDITERKLAEEALRESELRLKDIMTGSPMPAFVIDTDHRVTHWNKALEEMSGIKADEVIGTGKHWKAFYDRKRPCMADLLVDELPNKVPGWYAGKYNKSDLIEDAYEATDFFPALGNGGKWLRFTAAILKDSRGRLIGAIETLKDITDFRVAGDALRESEQRLKTVLEGLPMPTFVIDKDHIVTHWNKALEVISGIKADKVIGTRKHLDIFCNKDRPCMSDLLIDELPNKIPYWYTGKYKKSDLTEGAYEATDFFPALGRDGKWMRITAAVLKDSSSVVQYAIETLEDITARKLAEDALRESERKYMELSITDGLTKLYNSRYFYSQLKAEVDRANRYNHPLSLLLMDIDDFKHFNDTYGHLEGDQVLMRLGQVIQRCLRKTDSGYRYGGEEFTLTMPETKGEAATLLAERIRKEFEDEIFSPRPDTEIHKTISIGVTEYMPGEELTILLKRVDGGMYMAKEQGKNRVFFAK